MNRYLNLNGKAIEIFSTQVEMNRSLDREKILVQHFLYAGGDEPLQK